MHAVLTTIIFIPGIVISLYIAYYTWDLDALGSRMFSGFSLSLFLWLVGAGAELYVQPSLLDTILIQLHFIGIIFTSVFLFLFSVRYATGYSLSQRHIIALLIVPIISLVTVFTNPWTNLFWSDIVPLSQEGIYFSKLVFGPFLFLHAFFSYGLVIISSGLFLRLLFHRRQIFTKQTMAIIVAISTPLIVSVLYTFDLTSVVLFDPTPLTLTLTQVIFVLALYRTDFYSVVPGIQNIGWDYVADSIDSGICIADSRGVVVEHNKWFAEKLLDEKAIGKNISEILPELSEEFTEEFTDRTLQIGRDYYKISREELEDNKGGNIGFVYTVHSITAEMESQQQIRLLNRFLRHNLRNSLSIVLLGIERLKLVEAATEEDAEAIEENVSKVKTQTNRLLSMSEAAKDVENAIEISDVQEASLENLVDAAVRRVQGGFDLDDVDLIVDVDDVAVQATANFEIAIEQIIQNSIQHNSISPLQITISSEQKDDGTVLLRLTDNGEGIPDEAINSFNSELISEEKDPLYHGTGLGFGIAHWLAVQSDGIFRIEDVSETNSLGAIIEFELNTKTE